MRDQILAFLAALDEALTTLALPTERLELYPIGRSALILFYGLGLGAGVTRDFDVVRLSSRPQRLLDLALDQSGQGTPLALQYGLYLEPVPEGLPPIPNWFEKRCTVFDGRWRVLDVRRPEVHDLAVTKMKSFRTQDRRDLQFLCDRELLNAADLSASLERPFLWSMDKDGDPDRDRAFKNLRRVIAYLEGEPGNI
jgi:hypothetical protein